MKMSGQLHALAALHPKLVGPRASVDAVTVQYLMEDGYKCSVTNAVEVKTSCPVLN
jgi:hypothetical protein